MDYKDAYLERTQAQLEQLGAEVERLRAQAEGAKAEARFTYREHLKTLREKQEAATTRLRQLKNAGDETFEDMRIGADRAAQEFHSSLEEARSRFS
ncbi:MAG: hypothetical protein ACREDZ_17675 [Kiloniellales bacterium]